MPDVLYHSPPSRWTGSDTVIVVPCYNEERRLRFAAFDSYLATRHAAHVLFVDDGSRDGTLPLLLKFQKTHSRSCTAAALPQNCGKAEAVRQGLLAAIEGGARVVGYWDADLAVPLREIERMEEIIHRDPETHLVIGIRLPLLGRRIRRDRLRGSLGLLSALLTRALTRLGTRDTQCGAKLFRVTDELRQALSSPFGSRWLFDVELLMRLRQTDGPLDQIAYEYPLECWAEQAGSKVKSSSYLGAIRELARLSWRYGPFGHSPPATPAEVSELQIMQDPALDSTHRSAA